MKLKFVGLIILIVLIGIGSFFLWRHFAHSPAPISSTVSPTMPDIPTPSGWYSWGKGYYLPDVGNGLYSVTFGNQPINDTGNNTTTLIVVNVHDTYGKTDEEWIDTGLAPELAALQSATSTQLWDVVNGKLVLEAETITPAGGYNLNYFLFDNGAEYSFDLAPSYLVPEYRGKNLVNSPDAQTLRAVMESVAERL